MPYEPTTNFKDSTLPVGVDLGRKLVTKDYLLEVYGTILENSPASGLVVTPQLWTWGNPSIGDNDTQIRYIPVTTFAGGTNWKQVSGGSLHTVAIKTDGSLWVWGTNNLAQLGVNDTTDRLTPVTTFAGGTDWKQVSCGQGHTAAIKTDGSLWTWGYNLLGQLGNFADTTRSTPVTTFAGGNNWKSVSCGYRFTSAIKTDGSLWVWGANNSALLGLGASDGTQRSTPVTTFVGGTNWKQVSGGQYHMTAIKTDGSLWVWGDNGFGQLGINNTTYRGTAVTTFAGGTTWKSVACGENYTTAIKTDGSLWSWGDAFSGQLGTNDNTPQRNTPVTTFAGGNNWKQVDCGVYYTLAIKTDGSLWGWGSGGLGSLGDNTNISRSTPVTTFIGGNDWKQVSGGKYNSAAIKSIDYI
jgi:alpha-tubulin suppressor-like RCC1 family protein